MGRKANELVGHDKPFAQRLRALLSDKDGNDATEEEVKERAKSGDIKKLAETIGVDRSMISRYYKGESLPDPQQIIQIAKKYHVSVDWLLGLQEVRTVKPDIKMIARITGLSDKSIKTLNRLYRSRKKHVRYETLEDELENNARAETLPNECDLNDTDFLYHEADICITRNKKAMRAINAILELDYDQYNVREDAWDVFDDQTSYLSVFDSLYKAIFPQEFIPDGFQENIPEYVEFLAEQEWREVIRLLRKRENKEYGPDGTGKEYKANAELERHRRHFFEEFQKSEQED